MADYILFNDISRWQGSYNMAGDPNPAVAIKMGGGDDGLYMDSQAANNYQNAVNTGKVPIGYWFAGGGDAIAEADYFMRCMAPLADGDVYALDWEIENPDPVGWVSTFVNHIHDAIGVWPLVYMDRDRRGRFDWSPVLNNCGLWIAAPDVSFDADIPGIGVYMAHQGPIVNGVDTDAFFGTVLQLKAYGWHDLIQPPTPTPTPEPTPPVPDPTPSPTPTPEPTPEPVPEPTPTPEPTPEPTPTPEPEPTPAPCPTLIQSIIAWIKKLIGRK